jgi:hypothetical protein
MTDKITQHLELPPYASVVSLWAKEAMRAADRVKELVEFGNFFFGRDVYDCRVYRDDPQTHVRKPVDGEFYDGPLRKKIIYGTEEERTKGFFIDNATDQDGTEFSFISPFTMSTNILDMVTIASKDARVEGHYVADPKELAYQAMVKSLKLEPAERIFITRGPGSAEHALFCFPVWRRKDEPARKYLLYRWGGRYGEQVAWFFEGDVEILAERWNRMPRNSEADQYFRDRSTFPKFHEAPAQLPLTYDFNIPGWKDPRPVELRDITQAMSAMNALGHITGG